MLVVVVPSVPAAVTLLPDLVSLLLDVASLLPDLVSLLPDLVSLLPDITVLGPYTYLATEVVFGTAAVALLVRAGALARAARTIAVLYPVAYVWDWYTLEVGVFAIVEATGVNLLGIPVEEHLFIVVVPSLVVGVHETLHDGWGRDRRDDRERNDGERDDPVTENRGRDDRETTE